MTVLTGRFEDGSPVISLTIQNTEVKLLIDTGFTGELMLKEDVLENLEKEFIGYEDCMLATGDVIACEVYEIKFMWFDLARNAIAIKTEAEFSLLGLELLHDCKLTMQRNKNILVIEKE